MLDSFRGDRRFSAIALGPFSASRTSLVSRNTHCGPKLADSLVEKLYEGTEGNPFFTKELVRSLLDSAASQRTKQEPGVWVRHRSLKPPVCRLQFSRQLKDV